MLRSVEILRTRIDIPASEFIATAMLLVAIVGSGVMAERLSGGNAAIALLANSVATGGALIALVLAFGPISGAHMNPAVTIAAAVTRAISWRLAARYIPAQIGGAIAGVWLAHIMFGMPVLELSTHARTGFGQWVAEAFATFGLLIVIGGCRVHPAPVTAFAVAAYITGAYWFTASTSFANPAVTIARSMTDSFTGIRPIDAPGFIMAQVVGLALALLFLRRPIPA